MSNFYPKRRTFSEKEIPVTGEHETGQTPKQHPKLSCSHFPPHRTSLYLTASPVRDNAANKTFRKQRRILRTDLIPTASKERFMKLSDQDAELF